jgi:hypothetical protein
MKNDWKPIFAFEYRPPPACRFISAPGKDRAHRRRPLALPPSDPRDGRESGSTTIFFCGAGGGSWPVADATAAGRGVAYWVPRAQRLPLTAAPTAQVVAIQLARPTNDVIARMMSSGMGSVPTPALRHASGHFSMSTACRRIFSSGEHRHGPMSHAILTISISALPVSISCCASSRLISPAAICNRSSLAASLISPLFSARNRHRHSFFSP